MSKVMKSTDFISKLKHIESLKTVYYSVAGGSWAKWNGSSWNFDCVILVKAILWGWCENKNHAHGGAIYMSNGVKDDNADGIINRCTDISTNFSKLEKGELLWMNGHVGVYIGNGEVIECTAAWESKTLRSKIDSNGKRTRNGVSAGYWKKHGKLCYIDYVKEEEKQTQKETKVSYKKGDVVSIKGVYVSSESTEMLKPAITKGKITKVLSGARNPYLLEDGNIGWVNDSCIVSCESSNTIYTVKKGDTLTSIAKKYNTTWQKIYEDNKSVIGDNPNIIKPKMKLVIK